MAVSMLSPREPGLRKKASRDRFSRVLRILLRLFADGAIDSERCCMHFDISLRELQRDLRDLRAIGSEFGFSLSKASGGRVILQRETMRLAKIGRAQAEAAAALARIGRALGGPIEQEVRAAIGDAAPGPGLLELREPRPNADAHVSAVFASVKAAAADSARLEFDYKPARGDRATRRVEPYFVVARSGRYYLVAYDLVRRDWRNFALDAISEPFRRDGTFTHRCVPERLGRDGAVGWIHTGDPVEVSVRVTAAIAAAVAARKWQPEQRVRYLPDGGAEISLRFDDPGEAVRWALQFGADAVITSPSSVVALAGAAAASIMRNYATDPCRDEQVESVG